MERWVPWRKEIYEFGRNLILAKDLNFAFLIVLFIVNIYIIYYKITNKTIGNSNTFLKKKLKTFYSREYRAARWIQNIFGKQKLPQGISFLQGVS